MTTTTSTPNGPLSRYLLHPNKENHAAFKAFIEAFHHLVTPAILIGSAVAILLLLRTTFRLLTNRKIAADARWLEIALPSKVDAKGATMLWTTLHV